MKDYEQEVRDDPDSIPAQYGLALCAQSSAGTMTRHCHRRFPVHRESGRDCCSWPPTRELLIAAEKYDQALTSCWSATCCSIRTTRRWPCSMRMPDQSREFDSRRNGADPPESSCDRTMWMSGTIWQKFPDWPATSSACIARGPSISPCMALTTAPSSTWSTPAACPTATTHSSTARLDQRINDLRTELRIAQS